MQRDFRNPILAHLHPDRQIRACPGWTSFPDRKTEAVGTFHLHGDEPHDAVEPTAKFGCREHRLQWMSHGLPLLIRHGQVRRRARVGVPCAQRSIHVVGQVVWRFLARSPIGFHSLSRGLPELDLPFRHVDPARPDGSGMGCACESVRAGRGFSLAGARSVQVRRPRSRALARTIRRRITATIATLWDLPHALNRS